MISAFRPVLTEFTSANATPACDDFRNVAGLCFASLEGRRESALQVNEV
jgi:hypothetical protein